MPASRRHGAVHSVVQVNYELERRSKFPRPPSLGCHNRTEECSALPLPERRRVTMLPPMQYPVRPTALPDLTSCWLSRNSRNAPASLTTRPGVNENTRSINAARFSGQHRTNSNPVHIEQHRRKTRGALRVRDVTVARTIGCLDVDGLEFKTSCATDPAMQDCSHLSNIDALGSAVSPNGNHKEQVQSCAHSKVRDNEASAWKAGPARQHQRFGCC